MDEKLVEKCAEAIYILGPDATGKEIARAVLSCIEENGMVVVPRELTGEMIDAYVGVVVRDGKGPRPMADVAPERWAAFLSASPKG